MRAITLFLLFTIGFLETAQAQDCYRTFFDQGIQAYQVLDFETAINQFAAAKICDDTPQDNEVDEWINKAQNGYIDAIKAEQTKAQSLALTAKSIIELLKKENAVKAFRYAELALEKDKTVEARSALYECFYQLEEDTRKNYYVRDIQAFSPLENNIRNAGFLASGQVIFVFGELGGTIRLFDFDGQLIGEIASSVAWFDEQAYSDKTGILLSTQKIDQRHQLIARQLRSGQLQEQTVFSYPSPGGDITAAAISRDGQFIIVSFYDGSTHILNEQGKLLYELPKERSGANQINFSDGHEVAVSHSRLIKVFRLQEDHYEVLLDTIELGMYNANIQLSSNATYLMTAYGRRSSIWDVKGDSTIITERQLNYQQDIGRFSPNEKYATVGNGFFNLQERRTVNLFPTEVRNMQISPDLRYLAANIGSKKARIWKDQNYSAKAHGILGGHKDYIRQIAFSPDSTHILTASADNSIKLWNVKMRAAQRIPNAGILQGTFLRNDTSFIATVGNNRLRFFTQNGEFSHAHYSDEQNILAIDPSGKYVFANVEDGFEIYEMDISNKYLSYISGIRNTDTARFAQFLSDDQVVYYTDENLTYSLQVWNFKEGGTKYLSGYDTELISLSCAADQKHVAALDISGKAYLWSLSDDGTPTLLNSWLPHPGFGCSNIIFSRDSKMVITTGYDNLANVWTPEGELVTRLIDHLDAVKDADTTPDAQFIVTASKDQTAKIWTIDGALVATLSGYGYPVEKVRFSADGHYIITNNTDGTTMIWPFDPALILKKMNDYQIPVLTDSERAKYD